MAYDMQTLIGTLTATGTLHTSRIIDAFTQCDRARYIPASLRERAYDDCPLPIGYDQTISQPSTVAFMLELLAPQPGNRVLDIGSGSGWTTALLAHIVGPSGTVFGLERIPELVAFGTQNLRHTTALHAHIERSGAELGNPHHAPFDRILVSAAARTFPHTLVSQLCENGVLVMPVRDEIWRVIRIAHQPTIEKFRGFVFVPLVTD